MEREKLKKINIKKVVVCVVIAMVVAVAGLVMYSENVHEIGFIENIKQAIEDMINPNSEVAESNKATVVDVTGITPGDVGNHTCSEYYISEYDETYHWNKCKLCGKEYDKVAHNFIDIGWTLGNANYCAESNVHRYSCNCGCVRSDTLGRKKHDTLQHIVNDNSFEVYDWCNSCRTSFNSHKCYKEDGSRISCTNLGKCTSCGQNYTSAPQHYAHWAKYGFDYLDTCPWLDEEFVEKSKEDFYCEYDGTTYMGHVNESYLEKVSSNEYKWHVSITVPNGTTYTSTNYLGPQIPGITMKSNLVRNGTTWTDTITITFSSHIEVSTFVQVRYMGTYNGKTVGYNILDRYVTPDEEAPIIESINQDEHDYWEKTKEIVISGSENYCKSVKAQILDGENVIYEGTVPVTDGKWTITAAPEIEADEIGKNLTIKVTDPIENSSEQNFTVKKVDVIAPELAEERIVIGGDWSKEKKYTFTATDSGVGNVSIAFNDLTQYGVASVDGTTYAREYKFVGDVYNEGGREAVVYFKDELGNTSTQTIVIEKLDNTKPTIETATLEGKTVTVNAHDRHATEGEGSGIVKYRYMLSRKKLDNPVMTESNSTEVDVAESFVIDDLLPYYYVYLVAIDRAGNVSDVYTIGWESESDVTTVDATGVLPGDVDNHVCSEYYISEYDETYHWNKCKLCGKEYDKVAHSYIDYWTMGASSCHDNNWHVYTCTCGYSYKNQNGKRSHSTRFVQNALAGTTYYYCDNCSMSFDLHYCYDNSNEKIGTGHKTGTCKDCGRYYTFSQYYYNENPHTVGDTIVEDYTEPRDMYCGNKYMGHIDKNELVEISEGVWKQIVTITFSESASITDLSSGISYWGSTVTTLSGQKHSWNGNVCTIEQMITFNTHSEEISDMRIWAVGTLGSTHMAFGIHTPMFSPDYKAPGIVSIANSDNEEWSTTKKFTISGTENWCSSVKVDILGGEEVLYTGTASVINNNWTIDLVPKLETDDVGRNFIVRVTDLVGNSSTQEFTAKKIDGVAPETVESDIVIGGDWAKEKNYTFGATDDGVGAVSIAFNDLGEYKLAGVDEAGTFERKYRFIGDVYEPREAVVYYKDYLGNTTAQTITIDKLDNTKPTIVEASYSDKVITINGHDRHETEGEGSGIVNYRYITSRERLDNPEITDSNSTEVAYADSINVGNLSGAKYVYIAAIDRVGNVSDVYEVEINYELNLNSQVNLEAANGHGGVDLNWDGKNLEDAIYRAYQKEEGSDEWESISTLDYYHEIEPIKVLNVYPVAGSNMTFTYTDGTSQVIPKAASLKVWMEGGSNGSETFEAYGKNPITGQQLLEVTPISMTDLDDNPEVIWNYDIMMIGTWDGCGDQWPSDDTINIVEKYIKAGYGVLAGHDSIGNWFCNQGLNKLRKYFNIEVGYQKENPQYAKDGVDFVTYWMYGSTQAKVEKNGLLTNFPYELPLGAKLTIPLAHTNANAAKGNVWMNFANGTDNIWSMGSINNYYNAGGTGNPCYYLTTYNNTAMIQTGHSNCESTADERKVLANTLFYLKQRTTATSFTDNSGQDFKAPNAPELQVARDVANNNIKVTYNSEDNGSTYSYYVEAYDENDASILLATSNQRTETVTTGTKGYYYIVDTDSNNSDFDITKATYTEDENIALDVSNNGKYIHMKAIDKAGNVGAPSVKKIEVKSTVTVKLDGGTLNGNTADTTREEPAGTVVDLGQPTKEGFTFDGWEPVEGSVSGNNYTFPIRDDEVVAKWTRNNYGYRVEYYYNDIIDNSMTVTGEAAFDNELNSYEAKVKTGYKFDRVETLPLKITTNPANNVIRVYYVTDDSQKKTLSYSVEYYKGNDKVVADTQVVNQSVQYLAPDVLTVNKTDINTTDKYAGYRLDQIRVNDKLVSELPETVNNNDIIKVFFIKRNDLKYTVKHFDVETKQEIHEAQTFENQTFESVIEGSSKAIVIDGYTFGHTDPSELVIGVDESKNVINVYYSKMTGLTYTVNYLEKGTNKVVYPARTVDGQTFGTTVLSESEKINVDGYNYDSVEKESITIGSDSTKNIINIYYTKRNNLSYTVNYIEKGTTREIATSKTVNNVTFGTEIVSSSEMISIPGFNYDSAEKVSIVIGTGDNVINLYYTRRDNLSYKVKYMEKDTTSEIKQEKNVLNVVYGTEITANAEKIVIDGYVYDSADKDVMTVGVNEAENVITLYYTRRNDLQYTVNYLDEATGDVIHEVATKGNQVLGTVISAEDEKIEIAGYNYKTVNPITITIGTDLTKNMINVYYTKRNNLTYTVNYYEENSTTKVADSKTVEGQTYLASITENAINVEGYNKVEPTSKAITIGVNGNVINFYYTKKNDLSYIVNYYENGTTTKVADSKVVRNQKYKEEVTEEAINVEGYNKVEPTSKTITIEVEGNEVNFYYTKRTDLSYTVNYYEEGTTTKVAESKDVGAQTYLASVTENAIEVEGYDKVNPTNKTIVIGVSGNVINFYYTKRTDLSYTVNYLEKDINEVVAEAKVVNGQTFKAEITERAIDINGYDKVEPVIQSITIGVNENVINFYYTKKNNLSYKVNYLDAETNDVLHAQKVVNNKTFGDKITSNDEIIEIDGYVFESTDKTTITIGTGENVINIYYTRRNDLSYTMNFLEKGTNEVLAESVIVGNLAFETVVSSNGKAKTIEGYNFDSVDKASITIGTGVNEFNFYYTKRNDLSYTVNYLEQGSEEALAEAKVVNNKTFEEEITEAAIDIVGYNKVEPSSKVITIEVSGNVINFYYTKRNDLSYVVNFYEVGTKDEIAESETINNVVFETLIDSKKHAKAIDGYNFGHCDPATLTVGINAEENVIDIYYSRANGLTYTVNYVEKGNEENVLHPAKLQDEQTFGDVVRASDEVISIDGYNYDSVSAESITIGTDASKNVITIYYTRRNDLSYTVNYLEQGSNEVLATAKVVNNQVFETKVTEEAIEISGYVKPVVTTQSIVIGVEGNVINFYYTKRNDLTYEVNYYEEATTQKIAETKTVTGQTYKSAVRENAIEISGYNKLDPTTQTITVEVSNNVINFYYRRRNDLTYVVNYLEEGTNKKVVPSKTVNGQTYLTDVTEQAMPVDGYIAVEPTSKTITIQVEGNEFNFYYKKRTDLSYTVNYLEQGSNEVLAAAKVVNGQTYEAEVTEDAIDIAGYNKVEPQRQSIIIDVENNVINFYYTKRTDLSYTVNYLEKNTDIVIAPAKVVGKQTYKATATEQAIEVDGYDKLDPTEKSITIEVANNVINFYYTKKDDLNYKVNYLEKDTNKVIHEQKVATGRTFDEVIIARDEVIEIDGYNYSSVDKQSITIGTGENVINVYYTKRSDLRYTINYLEKDSNEILKAQKVVNNVVFETEVTINAEKVEIDGYVFDSASPESFKVGTNADANVMNIYYTRRGDLSYKVNYLDVEDGKVLHEQKVVGDQVLGTIIDSNDEIIEIDGYNFDTVDKQSITIRTSENVINIYYIKRNDLSYTINFLEKDTNEVLVEPMVVRNQVFGAIVSSTGKAIAINGYNYHSADKRTITIGTNEEENVFNLYYTKQMDLRYKVNYIERETDKVLADQKVVSNRTFGEVIVSETEAISINGYAFDGCDKETLTIGTGENVITVYYTKVNGLSYTVKYIDKDTEETIHAPKTEGNQTFEATILARNERIAIDGYVYDSCSKDRLTIGTGVNELTLYYIKRSDLNYKINYIEKGTGNTIKDTKTVNGMTYKDEVYAEDELIDIDGYYFDSYDKEKIIIGTRENVINMYYTRRTDLSYVVNYLEKGTNKEITGSKTVDNMNFGDVVESKNDVIEVYGYKFDSADKDTLTITTGENVINLYYIKKDTKVTVHFYEEGTTTKVSNDVVIDGKVFDRYEVAAAEDVASKYELVGTPDNAVGKMTEEEIVVTFYYRKKATKVIVHFYEEGTTNKLSENVVIEGRVDDAYTTKAAEDVPAKYELSITPENAAGSMTEEIIEVTYFYRVKDTYLNIRYLEKGTNIELATPERQNGKVEEDYITGAKTIEGYTLVEDSGNTTGKLTIAPITVTFYYLQNTSVEVNHIDKNTDEVLEKVTVDGLVGDKYTANAKDIANYVLVERPRVETVTMSKDKITLNYYYVHVSAGVIEKHVDVITGDILANAIHEGNEGDAYNIPSRTFEGYDLVREKMPSNARGTMTIEPIEVTYYYKYRSSVTAEYIDTITNRKLASDIVINGYEADDYVTERKEFDEYKLVEVPANSEGKMTKAPIKVTYRYVHESAGVEVKHIDIKTGKELVKAELIPGYEADEYTTKPQNIPGYDLVKDRIPTNAEGKMTIDKIIVEYYYIKQSSVTAKYIDKITGDEIEEEVLIEGHEGDKYETEAKEIEGYDLVEVPENAEGIMGADPSEVIYEYHRPAKVIINYIDVDTNEEITEPEVIEGHQDDEYETEAKEIKYYNLVEDKLPKNAKGKMTVNVTKDNKKELVDDETIVNYYYKKMEFSIKVDKIIDRVILNGKTLNINGDIGKIEINKKELPNAKLQIIYKIRVINNGELAGKATLLEKLPSGTTMSKADNQLWDISGATATMTTEEIKPGETKEYTVILDWTNSEGNVGNKENKVDVLKTENEAGFDEGKVDLEDSDADLVISISTGSSTYIIATGVAMVVLAGISIVLVKKTKEENE